MRSGNPASLPGSATSIHAGDDRPKVTTRSGHAKDCRVRFAFDFFQWICATGP